MNLRTLWATAQHWYATHSVRDRRIVLIATGALTIATAWFCRMQLTIGVDPKLLIAGAAAELIGITLLLVALGTSSRRVAAILIARRA